MNEWQFLAALAVPAIGLAGALFQKERTPGVLRRMRESAAALKDLPADSEAVVAINALIATQARLLQEREERRVNKANLSLAVVLSVAAAVATYFLSVWTINAWSGPFGGVVLTVSVIVGLFLVLVVAVGFGNIYKDPQTKEVPELKKAAKKAKDEQKGTGRT